jgi:hypothetical protein
VESKANTTPGEKPSQLELDDLAALQKYFAPDASLAVVDDVAKWLVGLTGGLGVVAGSLGLKGGAGIASGATDKAAIVLLSLSLVLAVAARIPFPIRQLQRTSLVNMHRIAHRRLMFRGSLVLTAALSFAAAVLLAAIPS